MNVLAVNIAVKYILFVYFFMGMRSKQNRTKITWVFLIISILHVILVDNLDTSAITLAI